MQNGVAHTVIVVDHRIISQIFKCNPTYLLGEMFKQKNLIQPQWGKVD